MKQEEKLVRIREAIRSVDKTSLSGKGEGNGFPLIVRFYDEMTKNELKEAEALCGAKYPGGKTVAFVGLSEKEGFVFTTEGFWASKNFLYKGVLLKKQLPMPVKYVRLDHIHQCGKYDRINSPVFCCVRMYYEDEACWAVPLYAAYLAAVVNAIKNALNRNTEKAQEVKKEEKSKSVEVNFEQLCQEAMALPESPKSAAKPTPSQKTPAVVTVQAEEKENESAKASEPKIAEPVSYPNRIRLLSDGFGDHKAAELYQKLKGSFGEEESAFSFLDFHSTDETEKAVMTDPTPDHLIVYTNVTQTDPERIEGQLSCLKLGDRAKIVICIGCHSEDDDKVLDMIEWEIRAFCERDYAEENVLCLRVYEDRMDDSLHELKCILRKECAEPSRHTLPFRMPVEAVRHVDKDGQAVEVIVGKVEQGTVKVGEKISLVGSDGAPLATVLEILDENEKRVAAACPEMCAELLLKGVPQEAIAVGKIAAVRPRGIEIRSCISGAIYVYKKNEGGHYSSFYEGMSCSVRVGTAECEAWIDEILTRDRMIDSGKFGFVKIKTKDAIPMENGMRFTVHNGEKRIAAGTVANV